MVEKYCLYFITLIITILFINLCYSTKSLLQNTSLSEDIEVLPVAVRIENKFSLGSEEESKEIGGNKDNPIALKRGASSSSENLMEVLNNEEVREFLKDLPISILKQLNVIFSLDEYNGYCYLVKLFKHYNKNWKKETIPLRNCVVQDDDIFGQYIFDSQKLNTKLDMGKKLNERISTSTSATTIRFPDEQPPEQAKSSDNIYMKNIRQFVPQTQATTIHPLIYFTTGQPTQIPTPTQLVLKTPSENKFKLYLNLKNKSSNFKPPPFDNTGPFIASFSPPQKGRQINSQVFPSNQIETFKIPEPEPQIIYAPQKNQWSDYNTNAIANLIPPPHPAGTTQHGLSQVIKMISGRKPAPTIQSIRQFQLKLDPKEKRYSDNLQVADNQHEQFSSLHASSSENYDFPPAPVSSHIVRTEYYAPEASYHHSLAKSHNPVEYHYYETASPPNSHGHAPVYAHSHAPTHAHTPIHAPAHAHDSSPHDHSHSWISSVIPGSSHHGYFPSKLILELSISILPFLAFAVYVILLVYQAFPPRFALTPINNNRTNLLVGREFTEEYNLFEEGEENSFVIELNNKMKSILSTLGYGNTMDEVEEGSLH